MSKRLIRKKVAGKNRLFRKKGAFEFDEVGLRRKDFKKGLTRAVPSDEGWFHIKGKR